jgi:hypothetical protein
MKCCGYVPRFLKQVPVFNFFLKPNKNFLLAIYLSCDEAGGALGGSPQFYCFRGKKKTFCASSSK